ncbi:hypothetical protein BJP36_36040 [Moorena producens JHB]|uniref:Uncharacterized protein n=1 Tax=Moorena producens (strain JHB) TaxID=1454205 RepID=A0A9Q9STU9_MOOP1|nr:hypothetical protein [Moorena producens]WAN69506.1 hypothetical protein BJP36_36040 [Moorena producens JHB]
MANRPRFANNLLTFNLSFNLLTFNLQPFFQPANLQPWPIGHASRTTC